MRLLTAAMAASAVLAGVAAAQATSVPLVNSTFTYRADGSVIGAAGTPDRMTFCGDTTDWYHDSSWNWYQNTEGGVLGWTTPGYDTANWGNAVENRRNNSGAYDGAALFTGNWNYIEQTASVNNITIQAGTYTLRLDAQQWDGANIMSAGFTADNALAGTVQNFNVSNDGTWSTVTAAVLVVAPDSPLIGQQLGFQINGSDNSGTGNLGAGGVASHDTQIDNVTLDFVAVPEPASMGLLAGVSLLALSRRRRSAM